jgi:hypothetical protein
MIFSIARALIIFSWITGMSTYRKTGEGRLSSRSRRMEQEWVRLCCLLQQLVTSQQREESRVGKATSTTTCK